MSEKTIRYLAGFGCIAFCAAMISVAVSSYATSKNKIIITCPSGYSIEATGATRFKMKDCPEQIATKEPQ